VLTALTVSTGTAIAGTSARNAADDGRSVLRVPTVEDTYTFTEQPDANKGQATKLVASSIPGNSKVTYLKFKVSGLPRNAGDIRATVELTRDNHHLAGPVTLSSVPETAWTEGDLTGRTAPAPGPKIAEVQTGVSTRMVAFDVRSVVQSDGTYAFAVSSPSTDAWASFRSSEYGKQAPTLVLDYAAGGGTPPPTAAPTPTAKPSGTASPKPTATPTAGPTKPAPPAPDPIPAGATLCGASFLAEKAGESRAAALSRMDSYFNGLEMVRLFYTAPPAWSSVLNVGKRPISISFKYAPKDIVAGKQDAYLRNWFQTAPRDQDVYWTYYHEPEDNAAAGEFLAADYRAAWTHLRQLANTANNPRLRATLILMDWTINPLSGRKWRDFYPGRNVIQVLGWDAYNTKAKKNQYQPPAEIFAPVVQLSRAEKLPFAIAETGSHLIAGDAGAQRAAWARAMVKYLSANGALYVSYFDIDWSKTASGAAWTAGDFRLRDASGMAVWREFCS
jgi:hypothetical protein